MNPRTRVWWTASATVTLLAAAAWLRYPGTLLLVLAVVAILACALLQLGGPRGWNRLAFVASTAAFVFLASFAQRQQSRVVADPEAARAALASDATAAMAAAIEREAAALQRIAVEALDAPAEAVGAFTYLKRLQAGAPARAVVLVRGAVPLAWAGRLVAPLDSLPGPLGAVGTPFHLVLYAIAGRGSDRVRAETLLHSERPANAIEFALDAPMTERFGVEGFSFVDKSSPAIDSFTVVRAAGLPVLGVRAVAPPAALIAARLLERGRVRAALALAIALVFFVGAVWRASTRVGSRVGALAVALSVVALIPLAGFSNASAIFDPALFFVDSGGPFTGSIGALAITAAIVLLAMLAALRARWGARTRSQALVAVVVIAGLGPYLLGRFARGIQFPVTGATAELWIAWEVGLFLVAASVLLAGVTAGQAVLGARRGLPLWFGPMLAVLAALLAPVLMRAPGAFPSWYPTFWAAAIGALALTRRGRGAVLPAAIVAACGAVTLVWGQSVRARVALAERDVEGLRPVTRDSSAATLLGRFVVQLDSAHAPQSRVELLARYAASDLASSDYPVEVTSWSASGGVIADLRVAMGPGKAGGLEYLAREAAGAPRPIIKETLGDPGVVFLVLLYPHADRSVTTVVVAPRTRLVPSDPFGALIGLGAPSTTDPPYSLRPSSAATGAFISTAAQWTRKGSELHGDWFLMGVAGQVSNVHATVELHDYEPLVTRGSLVVLLDLMILALLWLPLVIADGAFGRWLRIRRRQWFGSFRTRLTLVLFAFFVLPAAVFALWSYRRLQDDDRQARDLLVRETLRGMTATPDSVALASLAERFETPLFLFANGVLVQSSDPLYDALAPIGRLLPAEAAIAIAERDEGTAASEELVGHTPMRFGYRTVALTPGAQFVLGAPARTDELALDRRRRDLGILVLFSTAMGALAALWLSGLAARQFSRPIRALQAGAVALAAGEREPRLDIQPPAEFQSVFSAFRQMARDLEAGREKEAGAQRVLAWGEMARQVAHEIKNPLTPMRLGMQHLRRARHDPRVDFDRVLDENVARVLAEIDRLDEIARSFSRYGTAPAERSPAEAIDVAQAVHDVLRLEQLGGPGVAWRADGAEAPVMAMARAAELREVLLNVLENARLADAAAVIVTLEHEDKQRVHIMVRDDGHGIPADVLPRIFEPHFSTRTSGSGLGLAISRRMIEAWGGTIAVESTGTEGGSPPGTVVRITLVPAGAAPQL